MNEPPAEQAKGKPDETHKGGRLFAPEFEEVKNSGACAGVKKLKKSPAEKGV